MADDDRRTDSDRIGECRDVGCEIAGEITGGRAVRVAVAARALEVDLKATSSEDLLAGRIAR